ncbi:MAG: glycosyltransferase 87 family protein [Actinomycetota bacterium]
MRVPVEAPSSRWWTVDALLYACSALFAGLTASTAGIPLQRWWGRFAVWPYALAAAIAIIAIRIPGGEAQHRRRRTILVAVVFAATAIAPMAVAASRRAGGDPGAYAQSEVIIVEEAATALRDTRDPFVAEYRDGPLGDRPVATQVHFPYLPGMLAFGVPRALAGRAAWTDARVWFTLVALAVAGMALVRMAGAPDARLRTFQVLFALPTGALLLATGGVDIPVIAMLLGVTVLVRDDRPVAAGVMGGLALAAKQTSILVLPFLVLAVPRGHPRRRFVLTVGVVSAAVIVPFALWDVDAFVEDAILFPLGLGQGESAAATPTLGSLLVDLFPSSRTAVTVLLVAAIVVIAAVLLVRGGGSSLSPACARAAGAFVAAIALAPAARVGYLVYPANLIVWAIAFRAPAPGGRKRFRRKVLREPSEG